MTIYAAVSAVVVFVVLCAGILFSIQWLKFLMVIAVFLFGYLLYTISRNSRKNEEQLPAAPTPAAQPKPEPAAAAVPSKNEEQQHIYEEKLAAISKFSSVISHELRNPLASLKNISYFLSKALKIDDERTKRMLEMMSSEIDRTNNMVTDLTDVAHIKRLNKLLSDISALTTGVLDSLKLSDKITVERTIGAVSATIDADKYTKVVKNLMTNAADALPNGGKIMVMLQKSEKTFDLIVEDNGTGMDKVTLDLIFEPMFTTKTKALGLGLTFVKEVTALHGGTIAVASEQGKGTTVKITMPL